MVKPAACKAAECKAALETSAKAEAPETSVKMVIRVKTLMMRIVTKEEALEMADTVVDQETSDRAVAPVAALETSTPVMVPRTESSPTMTAKVTKHQTMKVA